MSPQHNYFDDVSILSSLLPLHSSSSALLVMMLMSEQANNAIRYNHVSTQKAPKFTTAGYITDIIFQASAP